MTSPKVNLYDASNIDCMVWPKTKEGLYAKEFLVPFVKKTPKHFVKNIDTEMKVLQIDDLILPITINHTEYENSYVCSPYTQYVSCAEENIHKIKHFFMRYPTRSLISVFKRLLKWGRINRVVIVNNWLFSTNLYPKISQEQIATIKDFLKQLFPKHAILFRSVLNNRNESNSSSLKKNKFDLIPSRKVYITDGATESSFRSRMFKSDLRLLEKSEYEVASGEDLSSSEISRLQTLYNSLYINKYSATSPQWNNNFFTLAVKKKILSLKAFRKKGSVDAVVGYFHCNGTITSPLFGYDTEKPQDEGLYRLIATAFTLEGKEQKALIHHSSGAGSFKKLRRAKEEIEYMAVFSKHLPLYQKIPWKILKTSLNTFGVPLMKKYDL